MFATVAVKFTSRADNIAAVGKGWIVGSVVKAGMAAESGKEGNYDSFEADIGWIMVVVNNAAVATVVKGTNFIKTEANFVIAASCFSIQAWTNGQSTFEPNLILSAPYCTYYSKTDRAGKR